MKGYRRATQVLPQEIIALIQEYVDGECIYIPRIDGKRKEWGCETQIRQELSLRNEQIYSNYLNGMKTDQLARLHCLSEKSIQRIVKQMKSIA